MYVYVNVCLNKNAYKHMCENEMILQLFALISYSKNQKLWFDHSMSRGSLEE